MILIGIPGNPAPLPTSAMLLTWGGRTFRKRSESRKCFMTISASVFRAVRL